MQHIELALDHDRFFCPVTGQAILGPEVFEPSPATQFVFLDDVGDFQHLDEQLEKLAAEVDDMEEDDDDELDSRFERFCKALGKRPTLVVFSITTHGMACGPVSSTVRIGIDMNWSPEEDDEA